MCKYAKSLPIWSSCARAYFYPPDVVSVPLTDGAPMRSRKSELVRMHGYPLSPDACKNIELQGWGIIHLLELLGISTPKLFGDTDVRAL